MLEKQDLEMIAATVDRAVEKRIEPIKNDISEMKIDIGELKSDVTVLKSDVAELKSDVTVLKSDVAELKDNVTVLESDVGKLKSDVMKLETMDKLILDEVEREHDIAEKGLKEVQNNLNEIAQYYRATKLENDNISLILGLMQGFSSRLEVLEKKMA